MLLDNEERIEVEFLVSKLLIEFNGKRRGYQAACIGYFGVLLVIIQRAFLREHERDHVFTATENLVKDMAEFIDKFRLSREMLVFKERVSKLSRYRFRGG